MKYVDIKSLVPGDVLYRRDTGEECILTDIIKDTNDSKARFNPFGRGQQWKGNGCRRYRFHGFDAYPSAMCWLFMSMDQMVARKDRKLF